MSHAPPQRPVKVFRAGNIKAAIWRRQNQESDRPSFSIRLQKRYFDQDAKTFVDTEYLFAEDLPRVELVVRRAHEFIMLREEEPGDDASAIDPNP